MLNENAKKWVAALRSGEYEQGHNALRTENTYCCLGVACDLWAKENNIEWIKTSVAPHGFAIINEHQFGVLPNEVKDWLGLVNIEGRNRNNNPLWVQNDSDNQSFEQIADFIESEPEGLFN